MNPGLQSRFVRDAALQVSTALPAAAGTAFSPGIPLGGEPGRLVDDFDVLIELPGTPALVDTKKATFKLQDSADGVTYADIPELAAITVTGAGGAGAAALEKRLKLPETARAFLRLSAAVETGGGDNTAITATLALVF